MRRPRPPPGASTARALAVGTTGGRSLLGRQRLLHDLLRLVSNFSAKLRTAVVDRASALRMSVRHTSMPPPELLSVRQAWSKIGHSVWQGQLRAARTLDLVTTPTAAVRRTTAAGMAAPGVTAAMVVTVVTVGVATPTTAAEETVEAEEARLVEVVARELARSLVEVTGAVAACLLYTSPSPRD